MVVVPVDLCCQSSDQSRAERLSQSEQSAEEMSSLGTEEDVAQMANSTVWAVNEK